jgi:hypothetical protein
MPEQTRYIIEAAKERDMYIILGLQTIKDPPEWLLANENARFKDSNGRLAFSAVSFWYEGLHVFLETALRAQLDEVVKHGLQDTIGAIQIDTGAWGEPTYPGAATEHPMGADGAWVPGVHYDEYFWCYGDNAAADFRVKMQAKYGTIAAANRAWGTSYASFAALYPPREGEARGQLWEDMLTWYLQTKRDFVEWQVEMFNRVVSEYLDDIPLIIYIVGGYITQSEWNRSIESGTATGFIKVGIDNYQIVDLAYKHNLIIQYGGLEQHRDIVLEPMLIYMRRTGKADIPIIGENPGSINNDNLASNKVELVRHFGLNGFNYMWARYLWEADGLTRTSYFHNLKDSVPRFKQAINNPIPWTLPVNNARPQGNVLRYDVTFGAATEGFAFSFSRIKTMSYTIAAGDVLEYDVFINSWVPGLGAVDGVIGGTAIRDNWLNTDQLGLHAHPGTDISNYAYKTWYHRKVNISNAETNGKVLTEIQLATHPMNTEYFSGQSVTIWYDNIRITNNGEVKLVIFESASDIDLNQVVTPSYQQRNVTSVRVSVVDVSDAR